MNVQTFSFDHFNPSVTRPGSVIDLQNALLVSSGSSHSLNDLKQVPKMGTSGLTEIGTALEEVCQNHISFAGNFPLASASGNQEFLTLGLERHIPNSARNLNSL
jgi:hypothetical protein